MQIVRTLPNVAAIPYHAVARSQDADLKQETRHSMVQMALDKGVKPTARFFHVSRNTVRKWLRRYRQSRVAGLIDHSRAPKRIPHKTSAAVTAEAIKLKQRLPRWGSRRLKRDYGLSCSHHALDRIYRAEGLLGTRKSKRHRRNDLRAEKARYRAFERTSNDTKYLSDLPVYLSQARSLGLPWFQYSHRDVRTGTMLLGFAQELSLSHATVFAEILIQWYRQHGIELARGTWSHDGGSEYIGAWNARQLSSYELALVAAGIE